MELPQVEDIEEDDVNLLFYETVAIPSDNEYEWFVECDFISK